MSRWHNQYPDGHAFFCTVSVDERGTQLTPDAVNIIYQEWEKARTALGVKIIAFCIMPDHIHVVLWSQEGRAARSFLHRTIAQTSRRLRPGGGFWKERPRVVPIFSRQVLKGKVDYIHRNPVRKELVVNPEDWENSSFQQLSMNCKQPAFRCDDWGTISL